MSEPRLIVTVPTAQIGDETSPKWRLAAAMASRTRVARVEAATWVRDHAGEYDDPEQALDIALGVISGEGDEILLATLAAGLEPE